ncbi:MAG: T9SS type A sorting domain-containing protein [Bacteroidota bacterium]
MMIRYIGFFLFLASFTLNLEAKVYHCDPVYGDMSNDGSLESPWSSLQMVFDAKKLFSAGDTIFLHEGSHGNVVMFGRNENYVVIKAFEDGDPVLQSLRINSASYWMFEDIHIASELPEGTNVYNLKFLVESNDKTDHLFFRQCQVYSTHEDITTWTQQEWFERTSCGFRLRGTYSFIHDCHIRNINFGISMEGRYSEVLRSTIENFVGDGIRALSSDSKYEYNKVLNSYDITGYNPNWDGSNPDYPVGAGNHDDFFQSYTVRAGGVEEVVSNVIVRGNTFIVYTDPDQIQKSACQGMGCFDGYFFNWVVENNLVITDNWHGITFLGIANSIISNNTIIHNPIYNDLVINESDVNDYRPWIWIGKMKEIYGGGPSNDNIIRNNLVIQNRAPGRHIIDDGINSVKENNLAVSEPGIDTYFVDFEQLDLHLKAEAPPIDQGINIDLPLTDLDANPRLFGNAVDCGAFEYNIGTPLNHCPHIDPIAKQSGEEGKFLDIDIVSSDPDHDPITLSISELPEFISFSDHSDGTGTLHCAPTYGDAGSYMLTLSATDGISTNVRTFVIDISVSTVGIETDTHILKSNIFPNPISLTETLNISVRHTELHSGYDLEIFDVNGKLLYHRHYRNSGDIVTVNTSVLGKRGSYIVRIAGESHLLLVY